MDISCNTEIKLFKISSYSGESSSIFASVSKAELPSLLNTASSSSYKNDLSIVPSRSFTLLYKSSPSPWAKAWSSNVRPSRIDPFAASSIIFKASKSYFIFSVSSIYLKWFINLEPLIVLRLSCKHRDWTVLGIFSGFVVAKINTTWDGGSSNVFNKALKLCVDSICTSSIRYILYLPDVGLYWTESSSSRIWSTPVLEAASTSRKSICLPSRISLHLLQSLQGVLVGSDNESQFRHLAKILARVVFPTPLVPENI